MGERPKRGHVVSSVIYKIKRLSISVEATSIRLSVTKSRGYYYIMLYYYTTPYGVCSIFF